MKFEKTCIERNNRMVWQFVLPISPIEILSSKSGKIDDGSDLSKNKDKRNCSEPNWGVVHNIEVVQSVGNYA